MKDTLTAPEGPAQRLGSAAEDVPAYYADWQRRELLDHPTSLAMQQLVPLAISGLWDRGGPGDDDFARMRGWASDFTGPGSERLVMPTGMGDSDEGRGLLGRLAEALAVMSFCPGGVRFGGIRYRARPDEWEDARGGGDGTEP